MTNPLETRLACSWFNCRADPKECRNHAAADTACSYRHSPIVSGVPGIAVTSGNSKQTIASRLFAAHA
jgi:hypothetical protein